MGYHKISKSTDHHDLKYFYDAAGRGHLFKITTVFKILIKLENGYFLLLIEGITKKGVKWGNIHK